MNKFKKGNFVRCIDVEDAKNKDVDRLKIGEIYLVYRDQTKDNVEINKYFGRFNYESNSLGGFYPKRFKKVNKNNLTPEEKFKYIKYKIGVRDECQKK